jgi:N-acylneuraminate cytidylyltransferase
MTDSAIAIIPARGGSKRIPRKNIKLFAGKPILQYSVEAALRSECFAEVMVSTDDEEIAETARKAGARVPFMRTPENSNDQAMTAEVLREVILEYRKRGQDFASLACFYPTAAFVTPDRVREGMELLRKTGCDSVLPVVRYSYPIQRALKMEPDGRTVMFWPENYNKRSQDLTPAFHDSGQFYCLKTSSLLSQMRLFASHTVPIELPESEVQDIDNEEDWKVAEMKFSILRKQGH